MKKQLKNRIKRKNAVQQALQTQKEASVRGFDWNEPLEALEKVFEEAKEVKKALLKKRTQLGGRVGEEIGDLLFAVINVARLAGVNPERCLSSTNKKFQKRFSGVLKIMKEKGLYKEDEKMSLKEMDAIWNRLKAGLRTLRRN